MDEINLILFQVYLYKKIKLILASDKIQKKINKIQTLFLCRTTKRNSQLRTGKEFDRTINYSIVKNIAIT